MSLFDCIVSKQIETVNIHVPHKHVDICKSLGQLWVQAAPLRNLSHGHGEHAYGDASEGTMSKVCFVISGVLNLQQQPLQSSDVFFDWGCGSGRWLLYAPPLLGVSDMISVGIECAEILAKHCRDNLARCAHLGMRTNAGCHHGHSEDLRSFYPARIVWNYDGYPVACSSRLCSRSGKSDIHQRVMKLAFCTPTVDVVGSTRMNKATFNFYFPRPNDLGNSTWKLHCIPKCSFGNQQRRVYLWFRQTPMSHNQLKEKCIVQSLVANIKSGSTSLFETRMQQLKMK